MAHSNTFVIDNLTEWEHPAEGTQRQILGYDDRLMVVKLKFDSGTAGALHSHPHSQSSMIVSGRFAVTIEGESDRILTAGDGYYVAPNLKHCCKCIDAGVLIDTFSPVREDFLK